MNKQIRFVPGHPAIMIGDTLVIADLHLGVEYEFRKSGMQIPNLYEKTVNKLEIILRKTNPREIIFIGDIKHKVPGISYQEEKQIPDFFNHFSDKAKIICLIGNHDPGIKELLPETVSIMNETIIGDSFLTHGHKWPDPEFLKQKHVIIGHLHPLFELKSSLGYVWREPVFVRAEFSKNILKQFPEVYTKSLPKLIVMPAFNDYVGGKPMNLKERHNERLGPLAKMITKGNMEFYLLDGTFLGKSGKS